MEFKSRQWEYLRKIWHLTPREVKVAKLVCSGMDNDKIKKKLHIKYNTVRAHLGNIFRKTSVKSKAGLVIELIENKQRARV